MAHTEVSGAATARSHDIADDSIADIINIIETEKFYRGPGAFTVRELSEVSRFKSYTVRRRCKEAVERGELVEVMLQPIQGDGRRGQTTAAYVRKDVYENWLAQNNSEPLQGASGI
jgi:hypothetical protein